MKAMAPFFSEYSLFLALGDVSIDRTFEALQGFVSHDRGGCRFLSESLSMPRSDHGLPSSVPLMSFELP
jgi:hypothetical protein